VVTTSDIIVKKVKIADLRPFPRQDALFQQPSPAEIELLAQDMHQRGLQHPIEILPDGTIVCGHCRVRAAEHLGWEEIDAIVRHDLADEGEAEIEKHVVIDNALRRQLGPMQRARCAQRLRELCHGGNQLTYDEQDDVYIHTRDWIGQVLNISGRHVSRMLAVLDTPPAVQQAYDERRLSLELAAKIANRSPDVQAAIARRIEQGDDPKEVAIRFLRRRRLPTSAERVYSQLITVLAKSAEAFEGGFSEVEIVDTGDDPVAILRQSPPMLAALAEHVERRREEQAAALAEKLDSVAALADSIAETE